MKNILFVLYLFALSNISFAQITSDPVPDTMPYVLDLPDSCIVSLPDSLGGDKYTGHIVIASDIDYRGNLLNPEIMKLYLVQKRSNRTVVDLWREDTQLLNSFSSIKAFLLDYIATQNFIHAKSVDEQSKAKDFIGLFVITIFIK